MQDSDSEEEELNTTHKHGGVKLVSRGGRTQGGPYDKSGTVHAKDRKTSE